MENFIFCPVYVNIEISIFIIHYLIYSIYHIRRYANNMKTHLFVHLKDSGHLLSRINENSHKCLKNIFLFLCLILSKTVLNTM